MLCKYKSPKIIIKYSKYLDPIFIEYCKSYKSKGWDKWVNPSVDEVLNRVKGYEREWSIYQARIIRGMQDMLGLKFIRNVIDVHVVSGNPRDFSNPIVIKSGYPADEFVDVLTHELIHVLLQDNNNVASWECINFVKSHFPGETARVQNHLIVHALLKYVYINILDEPDRLQRNFNRSSNASTPDYQRAWEIIEGLNYKKFILDYRKFYRRTGITKIFNNLLMRINYNKK